MKVITEYVMLQAGKYLTEYHKGNLPIALGDSGIYQLQKIDEIFNETAKKHKQRVQK